MNETGSDAISTSTSTSASVAALSPQHLARAYDRFVSARWRGEDEAAHTVATWFEAHWVSQPSLEPEDSPASASVLGGSGRGIRWYARDDEVFGYVPGSEAGYYRVAVAESVPAITAPWDAEPTSSAKSDAILRFVSADDEERSLENSAIEGAGTDRVLKQLPARD